MITIKLDLEYEGTNYHGWQIQPDVLTVEAELKNALSKVLGQELTLVSAARTDQGVHAKGQVVSFGISCSFPLNKLIIALNGILSPDIRVYKASCAKDTFHARHSSRYRIYRYFICNDFLIHPWWRNFSWWIPSTLNCNLMREAAACLVGTFDFSAFENRGSPSNHPVKCVQQLTIIKQKSFVIISIKADGFLYKMARNIVGTIVEVGRSRFTPEDVRTFLLAKDRTKTGPTAPPHGLFLWKVGYDRSIFNVRQTWLPRAWEK